MSSSSEPDYNSDSSDEWRDEDGSCDSSSEEVIDEYETKFLNLVDERIKQAELFCDQHQYVISFARNLTNQKKRPQIQEPFSKSIVTQSTQTEESISMVNEPSVSGSRSEVARAEIGLLRTVRDQIVSQRKEVSDKIKQSKHDHVREKDYRKLYEFEEAVDAIDTVIEYKNEIICERETILSSSLLPDRMEANLVTRLTSISLLDLQRLFCKFFNKTIDLRHSSKLLEKTVDELESKHDQISRRFTRNRKHVKELEEEYELRIKTILQHSKHPTTALSEYLHFSKAAKAARRKQYDLELSLTELLVRHGYLSNGADYEVNQVVKMLGVDALQLRLYQVEDDDDEERRRVIPARVWSTLSGNVPGISLRDRGKKPQNHPHSSHYHHPPYVPTRDRRYEGGYNNNLHSKYGPLYDSVRDRGRHGGTSSPPTTEVTRESRKITIQLAQLNRN